MPGPTYPILKSKITSFSSTGATTTGAEYFPESFVSGRLHITNLWKAYVDPNKTFPNYEYQLYLYDCFNGELLDQWNNSSVTTLYFEDMKVLSLADDYFDFTKTLLQNQTFDNCFYCLLHTVATDTYEILPISISILDTHFYSVSSKIFILDVLDASTDKDNIYFRLKNSNVSNIAYLYIEHYEEDVLTDSEIILQADLPLYEDNEQHTDYNSYRRSLVNTPNKNIKELVFIIGTDNSISQGVIFEFYSDSTPETLQGQNYELSVNYQKKGMVYRLHPVLKNDFWTQFIEGVSEELFNLYAKITELKEFIDTQSTNPAILLAIATKFGYIPNRILDDSITFLQREINNIGLRVQMKGTYDGYKFIFRLVNALGYVYNVFHNDTKFIRAIQETETFNLLRAYIADWTHAFIGVEPYPYYSLSVDSYLLMDEGTDMDADPLDYMDELIVSHPTKHLAIEWLIQETFIDPDDSVETLMNSTRMEYILFSTFYNRKLTDYPHVGCQVSFPCDETGYYNKLTNGTGTYTVDDLKSRSSVTPLYRSIIQTLSDVIMDDTPIAILDPSLPEYFDQSFITTKKIDVATDFFKIVAGNGSKNQLTYELASRSLNTKYDKTIFHVGFDETFDVYCNDSSINLYTGELLGTATRSDNGVISRSYYNASGQGVAYFSSIQNTSTNREISLWVKGIGKVGTTGTIFNNGYLKIEKPNSTNYDFKFTFTGNITSGFITLTYSGITDPNYMTTPILIYVKFNETTHTMTASLKSANQVVSNTLDYSTFGLIATPNPLTIGGDYDSGTATVSNAITGYIDDVWVSENVMTTDEYTYLFTNKICDMSYIDKKFYEYQIQDEVYEDLLWYVVTGRIDSQKVKGISIAKLYKTTPSYTGVLEYFPVTPKSVKLTYLKDNLEYEEVQDDGFGKLVGAKTSGTIDYTTGTWVFNSTIENPVINEILHASGSGTSHLVAKSLAHANIKTNTFTLEYYTTSGGTTRRTATASGGVITGNDGDTGTTGTIDLTNGVIDVIFSSATDPNFSIRGNYTYIVVESHFENTSYLKVDYITETLLDITEAGIENDEGKLMAYATFPPIELRKPDYHLSVQFLIKKT